MKEDYLKQVSRTVSKNYAEINERLDSSIILNLLHGAVGICTEGGELLDTLKKFIFYGKNLDTVNIVEEIGDVLWYIGLICLTLDIPLEEVMTKNINKLKVRYPEKFIKDNAINRDLQKEREVLEN